MIISYEGEEEGERFLKVMLRLSAVDIHNSTSVTVTVVMSWESTMAVTSLGLFIKSVSEVSHTFCLQMCSRMGKNINWSEPRSKEDNFLPKFAASYFWAYLIRLKTHRKKSTLVSYCVLYHCWHSNIQCRFLLAFWLHKHCNSVWSFKVFLVFFFLSNSTFW